jgi:hypothetical protein
MLSPQFSNNTQDLLNPDKKGRNASLAGQYGFDPSGNNEIGAMFRRGSFGLYPRFASEIGFGNELEADRQARIRKMLQQWSEQNLMGRSNAMRQGLLGRADTQGARIAAIAGGTPGIGQAQGAALAARLGASRQADQYQAHLGSAGGQMEIQDLIGQLTREGQSLPSLDQLLQMYGPIEGRSQANAAAHASSGLGGIAQILGNLAGSGALGRR